MKFERITSNYGTGTGATTYKSELFEVVVWKHHRHHSTTLEYPTLSCTEYLRFDGVKDFYSDEDCIDQLSLTEVVELISTQRELAFRAGVINKLEEIKGCLEV